LREWPEGKRSRPRQLVRVEEVRCNMDWMRWLLEPTNLPTYQPAASFRVTSLTFPLFSPLLLPTENRAQLQRRFTTSRGR
jgi:hypothetical protein